LQPESRSSTASRHDWHREAGDPIFNGWFCFGGTEIINNARAVGYARTASQLRNYDIPTEFGQTVNYCDINWHWVRPRDEECLDNLRVALGDELEYEAKNIPEEAPWYSVASGYSYPTPPSRKFLGAYALEVTALSDSTREVGVTEGILSGGVLGRERLAVPRFRFRVMLTAVDEEGLEYGQAWLSKALSEQACSTHGPSCGSSDLTFFAACPPIGDVSGFDEAYEEKILSLTRMYHDVKCVEGPIRTETMRRAENSWGAVVEFTLAAGVPSMFGAPANFLPIPLDGETVVMDVPLNYIPYPSAEIAGVNITVSQNYVLNPSVETNDSGWGINADAVNINSTMLTFGRVTGELQASGTASYRVVFTATGPGANGAFAAQQTVDLTTRPSQAPVSVSIWAAEVVVGGAPVREPIQVIGYWRDGPSGTVLRTDVLGTIPVTGGSLSARSLIPPAGATHLLVRVNARITSWNAGTVVRLYTDALAVTVP